ncbi:hypothetical protein ACQJBY_053013 [Aegilops geniculata]
MVLRDAHGEIIFTACRQLFACDNALDAELEACKEGLALALERTTCPIQVELDCSEAVVMLQATERNRSRHMTIVSEIQEMLKIDREISVTLISRIKNKVSHSLAAYGRCTPRTTVWLGGGTDEIVNLCKDDAPP